MSTPNQSPGRPSSLWLAVLTLAGWGLEVGAGVVAERIALPPLRLGGKPVQAHTQGIEVVDGRFWVTARREDATPRQALLLHTAVGKSEWEVWELPRPGPTFDHPGGLQSDGQRLWIPLAESRRDGKTVIQAYALDRLVPGRRPVPEVEFPVPDHIGALAVTPGAGQLLGASWDTATVYQWNADGVVQATWTGPTLQALGLGTEQPRRTGLAVQDWKRFGNRLYASGLERLADGSKPALASRVLIFPDFPGTAEEPRFIPPPMPEAQELSREGMAVTEHWIYFLPGDLGETNTLFRLPCKHLTPPPSPRP